MEQLKDCFNCIMEPVWYGNDTCFKGVCRHPENDEDIVYCGMGAADRPRTRYSPEPCPPWKGYPVIYARSY
ncbi:MAG: hypothetical protein FD177_1682 [Desulfovibrionaceae bacterium]|nr:MAG: hypothetical protein FD177_1682 [Desulfovibrionaceae bacterium]